MVLDMQQSTILLLGANGQLGHELQQTLAGFGQLVALNFPDIDFMQPESLRPLVRGLRPALIVNAAAYTAVDKAESNPERSRVINAQAPGVLAEEAGAAGAVLVHYSTDYVFDGTKSGAYVETDTTNPLSVYGRTKLAGEQAVQRLARHLTFRTSWVVGAHGANFIRTMLRLAGERDTLRVVADQYGAPTAAKLLAETTVKVLAKMDGAQSEDRRWGLYHLVASGETTWNGFARHVIARAQQAGIPLRCSADAIAAIPTSGYPTPAQRPTNSRLDTAKLRTTFGVMLPDWREGVDAELEQIFREMKA